MGLKKRVWLNQHNFLQKPTKKGCFTLQIKVVGYEKYYFHFYFWKNVLLFGSNAIERFLSFGVFIRLQKKKFDYLE